MKAVRLTRIGARLAQFDTVLPTIGPHDVLVRVKAAGICHSDAHYRAGRSPVTPLPLTLGHEVAGVVEQIGRKAAYLKIGDRVCLHYLVTCGTCEYCRRDLEQFCVSGAMIGKHRDGGYAEFIAVPGRNAFVLPPEIPLSSAAVMMCSAATSLHALHKGRLKPGETVAVFGVGGLGMSAVQLARSLGASTVYALDINTDKLNLASRFGAIPINAAEVDPVGALKELTNGRGVDLALELIGLPPTMQQAVKSLGIQGRALLAGITDLTFEIAPYADVLNKESEIIGVSDHLASEIPQLIEFVRLGKLDLSKVITRTVPLDADAINQALDGLEKFDGEVRTVIEP